MLNVKYNIKDDKEEDKKNKENKEDKAYDKEDKADKDDNKDDKKEIETLINSNEKKLLNTNIPKDEYKITYDTIVLSSGSSKGLLILGALQFAKDSYFIKNIKTFIGTSVGSMICYLLAIGYTPIEIVVDISTRGFLEKISTFDYISGINCKGLTDFNIINTHLENMTMLKLGFLPTLKQLKDRFNKTLICCTYNLTKRKVEYLNPENNPDLPCLVAIRMSSNLPLIFDKFKYKEDYYIDGGIIDNFPIDIAHKRGGKILGINISSNNNIKDENNKENNILEYVYSLIQIPVNFIRQNKIEEYKEKTTIIELNIDTIKFFNFNINSIQRLEMFSKGYSIAKQILE